jgi:hypothetical protein
MSKNTPKKGKSIICRDAKTGRFVSCRNAKTGRSGSYIHSDNYPPSSKRKKRKTDGTGPKRK